MNIFSIFYFLQDQFGIFPIFESDMTYFPGNQRVKSQIRYQFVVFIVLIKILHNLQHIFISVLLSSTDHLFILHFTLYYVKLFHFHVAHCLVSVPQRCRLAQLNQRTETFQFEHTKIFSSNICNH